MTKAYSKFSSWALYEANVNIILMIVNAFGVRLHGFVLVKVVTSGTKEYASYRIHAMLKNHLLFLNRLAFFWNSSCYFLAINFFAGRLSTILRDLSIGKIYSVIKYGQVKQIFWKPKLQILVQSLMMLNGVSWKPVKTEAVQCNKSSFRTSLRIVSKTCA